MASILTVNVGQPRPSKFTASKARATGIDKRPVDGPVEVRDPGPKTTGLGSGLVGDYIGDGRHHGGTYQAVYAYAREDLDTWAERLGRPLPNGFFGENLTTEGIDVSGALLGEKWRIGDVVLQVTEPRIPCNTFRGWVGEKDWLKLFLADARPGAYLSVVTPGAIAGGQPIEVIDRPDHDVTIALAYRAVTTERDLLPYLLTAGDSLVKPLRDEATAKSRVVLDD